MNNEKNLREITELEKAIEQVQDLGSDRFREQIEHWKRDIERLKMSTDLDEAIYQERQCNNRQFKQISEWQWRTRDVIGEIRLTLRNVLDRIESLEKLVRQEREQNEI